MGRVDAWAHVISRTVFAGQHKRHVFGMQKGLDRTETVLGGTDKTVQGSVDRVCGVEAGAD